MTEPKPRLARHLLLWLDPGGIIPMGR